MAGRDLAQVGVLVTRPQHQAQHLIDLIKQAGGVPHAFPVVEILEPLDAEALFETIDRLHEFALAIFISPNAVNKAMNLVRSRRGDWPAGLRAACVGRGSAKELRHFGLDDVLVPTGKFDSEALLALPEMREVAGKRVVIFRGDGGRELLGHTLVARGALVEYAECYRRGKPQVDVTPLLRLWARGEIDVVTFTSAEALRNLYDLVGKLGQQWLVKTPAVVVSGRIAEVCRELGFKTDAIVTAQASDEAIVEAINSWRTAQNPL